MSLLKANAVQLGQSVTATNNFTWYQPASPDGTVRLGNGNSGSVTDLITVGSTGNLTFTGTTETYTNSVTITAASTKTLTLNGGAGSNGLVLDASNNVGIGTSSARQTLTVQGGIGGITASTPSANTTVFSVSSSQVFFVFVSWASGAGWAVCLVSGSTGVQLLNSSNSVGGNSSVDTINNTASNSGNGIGIFVYAGSLWIQRKTNYTGTVAYINLFGM